MKVTVDFLLLLYEQIILEFLFWYSKHTYIYNHNVKF